ncbi:MAG: DUF4861 domain-containing protein [Bacteroides sp.]|nr:DUF4861 domain-containing protein [Bacteroides sp.]
MKKIIFLLAIACVLFACDEEKSVKITLDNPTSLDRNNEIVEVSMKEVAEKLQLAETADIVVLDSDGGQVPYQITSDEKLIFPVSVGAGGSVTYTVKAGTPETFPVLACGRQYPERVDDIAWENDLTAYRTYGPALQATGERAFGYDIWIKYGTTEPVVEARYALELDSQTLARIDSLKTADPEAAKELRQATSYHVDHGNGFDAYKVGPTLGGGTAALLENGQILYPYAYKNYKVLDNGPLRFKVELEYNPLVVNREENVVETRVITLDAGSYLNKTSVSYSNLTEPMEVATGIVLHDDAPVRMDAEGGYMTYLDPTEIAGSTEGLIFVGAAFPGQVKEIKPVLFSAKEKKEERGNAAEGHLLAISDYQPGGVYTYYWGGAWNRAQIKELEDWNQYVSEFAQKVRNPLSVTIK